MSTLTIYLFFPSFFWQMIRMVFHMVFHNQICSPPSKHTVNKDTVQKYFSTLNFKNVKI